MTSGSLPTTPGTPIGQVTRASSARGEATRFEPMPEGGPLALAADQADEGQVVALAAALQAGGDDVQVLGVAEAHDQHARAGVERGHRAAAPARNARSARSAGRRGGEDLVAAVDPVHAHRQRAQQAARWRDRHGRRRTAPPACARAHRVAAAAARRRSPSAGLQPLVSAARPRRRSIGRATGPSAKRRSGWPPPARRAARAHRRWHRTRAGRRRWCRPGASANTAIQAPASRGPEPCSRRR